MNGRVPAAVRVGRPIVPCSRASEQAGNLPHDPRRVRSPYARSSVVRRVLTRCRFRSSLSRTSEVPKRAPGLVAVHVGHLDVHGDHRVGGSGGGLDGLGPAEYRPTIEACERTKAATAGVDGSLVLLGLFADSPHETIARLKVDLLQKDCRMPDCEAYNGVPDPRFYVGCEQPQLFDLPLLATGREDLYHTLNPTPEFGEG